MSRNGLANGIAKGIGTTGAGELWVATLMFGVARLESSDGLASSLAKCFIIILQIVVNLEKNWMNAA